jgi:hypothetical protein
MMVQLHSFSTDSTLPLVYSGHVELALAKLLRVYYMPALVTFAFDMAFI